MQDNQLHGNLTVAEAMKVAANLKLGSHVSKTDKEEVVSWLFHLINYLTCGLITGPQMLINYFHCCYHKQFIIKFSLVLIDYRSRLIIDISITSELCLIITQIYNVKSVHIFLFKIYFLKILYIF